MGLLVTTDIDIWGLKKMAAVLHTTFQVHFVECENWHFA